MASKLKIQSIIDSGAITADELAELLFSDRKFPKSALRRLALNPENCTVEQLDKIAKHLNMTHKDVMNASFVWHIINAEPLYSVVENGITARVAKEFPNFAVCLKNNTKFVNCQFRTYVTVDGFSIPQLHELIEKSNL